MRNAFLGVLISFLSFFANSSFSQFTKIDTFLGDQLVEQNREYGSGISCYDVDLNGWDDITFPRKNDSLLILLNGPNGFTKWCPFFCDGEVRHPLWGDFDNDGDPDLYLTFNGEPNRFYINNGNLNLEDATDALGLLMPAVESYGASWGDINNDGWLDLFVSNYDQGVQVGCWLFINQQGQSFIEVGSEMGINIDSDFSFQATIVDFNGDMLPDIHVANDRVPNDAYLINYGDFFINESNYAGLIEYSESMCSSVTDYNHDGILDIYTTNSDFGNFLWQGIGDGTYGNKAEQAGLLLNRSSWGATWIDYNNDTWDDIFINHFVSEGDEAAIFTSDQGLFSQLPNSPDPIDAIYSFASAKGDFNFDGAYDLMINAADNEKSYLLMNNGTDNNFFRFKLEGVLSNRDGVGAKVSYHIGDQELIKYIVSGDSYMGQDSQWNILGLGGAESIDELSILWPSGHVDEYFNLMAGSTRVFQEGFQELSMVDQNSLEILSIDTLRVCAGDSIQIGAVYEFGTVLWSNGSTSDAQYLSEEGSYSFIATSASGIQSFSDTIHVLIVDQPLLDIQVNESSCYGISEGIIELNILSQDWFYQGATQTQLIELSEGDFNFSITSIYGCVFDTTISVSQPEEIITSVEILNAVTGEFSLEISGGTSPYNVELNGLISEYFILAPGINEIVVVDSNGCSQELSIEFIPEIIEGVHVNYHKPDYFINNSNHLVFNRPFLKVELMNSIGQIHMINEGQSMSFKVPVGFSFCIARIYWSANDIEVVKFISK
jgi:hypothetical protein